MRAHDILSTMGKATRFIKGSCKRTLGAQIIHTITSRHGKCRRCGACCQMVVRCPYLSFDSSGLARCEIYKRSIRPINCMVFPRDDGDVTEVELSKKIKCGYRFKEE